MTDETNIVADDQQTQPTEATRYRFWNWFELSHDTWFDRFLVPTLLLIQVLYTAWRVLLGDWVTVVVSLVGIVLMVVFASIKPIQRAIIRQPLTRSHAFYLMVFWVYSQLFVFFYRTLASTPTTGKDSEAFYVALLIFAGVTFRLLLSLYALTPYGYRIFFSRIPFWEQIFVALNEFISISILAFVLGRFIARLLQPDVFTLELNLYYNLGLFIVALTYAALMQAMWIGVWNRFLGRNNVWVRLARLLTPIALVVATIVIIRHFTNLAEPRTANLLGDADVDQTILALSPILWMMIFYVLMIVYSGGRGLRRLLIPNKLMENMPVSLARPLRTVSDMDILLIIGLFATVIPVQLFLFNNTTFIGGLQAQLQGNALIDSSEQALAFIFAIPFYLVALLLLVLYGIVMANPRLSAHDRDTLVDRLPITLLMMFIITLYLAAIPFSQVLISGRIPNIGQDLGYILAFDVLIPLILFYVHYYLLIRLPYGRGQSRWRTQFAVELDSRLAQVDKDLAELQTDINRCEVIWKNRDNIKSTPDEQIGMLFDLIELNGKRDRLNMERLQILSDRQELQDISESPISLTIATMPNRIIRYGIPLVLLFKIYEWAIVNDGLREVANNPNIGILEFFKTILENTNF